MDHDMLAISHAIRNPRFKKIETVGILSDGRKIRQTTTYPEGASYIDFLRKDLANRRAFGDHTSFTRGEYLDGGTRETKGKHYDYQRHTAAKSQANQGHASD